MVPDDANTQYKDALLRETREELAKADGKASILLAASGIAFTALLTGATTSGWDPDKLLCHTARILTWSAIAVALLGGTFLGAAVKPRLRPEDDPPARPHYFGDVAAFGPSRWEMRKRKAKLAAGRLRFENALDSLDQTDSSARTTDQIWQLSHVARRKYWLVSAGIWAYAVAVIVTVIAVVLEKQWL